VAGWIAVVGSAATFTPAGPLERGANYVLTVARGVRSAQGSGALASAYNAPFRVAPPPRLIGSTPADGESAAHLDNGIQLNFSTPMEWGSVQRNLTIEPKPSEIYTSTNEAQFNLDFHV